MRKFIILLLCIVLTCGIFTACWWDDSDNDGVTDGAEMNSGDVDDMMETDDWENTETAPAEDVQKYETAFMTVTGHITEITSSEDGTKTITVENEDENAAYSVISAKIGTNALYVDTLGAKKAFEDLAIGKRVRVVTDANVYDSTPPSAEAVIVMLEAAETEESSFPYYIHVTDTEYKDGLLYAMNANGDIIICISEDMEIETLDDGAAVDISQIKNGAVLLAWYDSVTLSEPPKATPTRIIFIENASEDVKDENTDNAVTK
jgi:hypothetical protein